MLEVDLPLLRIKYQHSSLMYLYKVLLGVCGDENFEGEGISKFVVTLWFFIAVIELDRGGTVYVFFFHVKQNEFVDMSLHSDFVLLFLFFPSQTLTCSIVDG